MSSFFFKYVYICMYIYMYMGWQVERVVCGSLDAQELASRIAHVAVGAGDEQGGDPRDGIRLVYRLIHRIVSRR